MTTIINVKTLNANELLLDYTKGVGATAGLGLEEPSPDTVKGFELGTSQLIAIARMFMRDKKTDAIAAMSRGYLGVLHESQYNENSKTKSDALVTTKVNLTAAQYLSNAIKTATLDVESIEALLMRAWNITDKTTKADLSELVASFSSIFVSEDSKRVYTTKVADEAEAAKRFEVLEAAGFSNIRAVAAGRYCAEIASYAPLDELTKFYDLIGLPVKLPSGLYQVNFKDLA